MRDEGDGGWREGSNRREKRGQIERKRGEF